MIRITTRNIIGFAGSAVMTLCSIGMLNATYTSVEAHKTPYVAPVALHSDTISEWQLAEKDLLVVRATRA